MAKMGRPRKPKGERLVRTGIAIPAEMQSALRVMAGPDVTVSQKIRQILRTAVADYTKPEATS